MDHRLFSWASLAFASALFTSDRAARADCAGPARTELTLSLVSLEPIDGAPDVAAERARLGETATFSGVRYTARDADGGTWASVLASFRTDQHDSHSFEATR